MPKMVLVKLLQGVYDLVEELDRNNSSILEIGVGTGNLASKFFKQ